MELSIWLSCHQNAGQNHNLQFVAEFKYLGTTVTNENCIHEEIKGRLNLGSAGYHSVHNLLSSHLIRS